VRETAYSLFIYVEGGKINQLGVVAHDLSGTDDEKLAYLTGHVESDHKTAKRYAPRLPISWAQYQARSRLGRHLELFEQIFQEVGAAGEPLLAITPIVDGAPRIDAVTGMGPTDLAEIQNTPMAPGEMVDYLRDYVTDGVLDLPRLLNDDYFKAVKMLYNAHHFVSAAKLLMSFIDTVAFIEMGDTPASFSKWLDAYADLTPLGVTAKELWEFRNGLLHMTNLSSRAVASGATAPLIIYFGLEPPATKPSHPPNAKYLDLKGLLAAIFAAVTKWIETYNGSPDKLLQFVERYDLTVSDARLAFSYPRP